MPLGRLVKEVFLESPEEEKEENVIVLCVFEMTLKNGEIGGKSGKDSFLKCLLMRC